MHLYGRCCCCCCCCSCGPAALICVSSVRVSLSYRAAGVQARLLLYSYAAVNYGRWNDERSTGGARATARRRLVRPAGVGGRCRRRRASSSRGNTVIARSASPSGARSVHWFDARRYGSAVLRPHLWPCVCLSVCLSHAGSVRQNVYNDSKTPKKLERRKKINTYSTRGHLKSLRSLIRNYRKAVNTGKSPTSNILMCNNVSFKRYLFWKY